MSVKLQGPEAERLRNELAARPGESLTERRGSRARPSTRGRPRRSPTSCGTTTHDGVLAWATRQTLSLKGRLRADRVTPHPGVVSANRCTVNAAGTPAFTSRSGTIAPTVV